MDNRRLDFSAFRSIADIVSDLKKPVAMKHLEKRRQGGTEILYISWTRACDYLDYYAPGWYYEIVHREVIRPDEAVPGKYIITVRIYIPAKEGLFWRDATGLEDEKIDSWGDVSSNAESMALRRAAVKFGLARYLYDVSPDEKQQLLQKRQIELPNPKGLLAGVEPATKAQDKAESEKDAQKSNIEQIEPIEEAPKAQDIPIRIQKAQAAITALGYTPFKRMDNVTDEQYFDRLTAQYKKCKESPKTKPEVEKKEKVKYLTQIQNSAITNLCDTFGINPNVECQSFLGKQVIELSVEEADQFIEYLQSQVEDESTDSGSVTINQDESITRAQLETISIMMKKVKGKSMIDFVQEYTDGRAEVFEDMSQTEADKLIHDLSAQLNDQAKAAKTKK